MVKKVLMYKEEALINNLNELQRTRCISTTREKSTNQDDRVIFDEFS